MYIIKILFISILLFLKLDADELKKVSLQLNWKYQFEFAGFIMAKEKGYYKDAGYDVDLKEFQNHTNVISDVQDGKSEFGVYDSSLLFFYNNKKPIVFLANYFKRSALVFVTKQDIITPEDLIGKRVMAAQNELDHSSLGTLLKKHNVKLNDFQLVSHTYNADEFIAGNIDVMSAYVSNELYHIKKAKVPFNIIDPTSYGITAYGMNLFTSKNYAKKNGKDIRKFIDASNLGWKYALENPQETIDIIYDKYSKVKSKEALEFEYEETKKLIMQKIYKIGNINISELSKKLDILKSESLIPYDINANDLIFDMKSENIKEFITFNQIEIDYLHLKESIKMCVDPDWMPYESIVNKKHVGIAAEYMKLIEEKINKKIELVETKNWDESLSFARKRDCDILSLAMETKSRKEYLRFTDPYLSFPIVIATQIKEFFVAEPSSIINEKRLGIVKNYAFAEVLKEKFPQNKLIEVSNVLDGLQRVRSGELYGFIGSLASVGYELQHNFSNELKINGKFDDKWELGVGVRNDDDILYSIFSKAVKSIDESKKQEILNKWISVKYEQKTNYDILLKVSALFLVIMLLLIYRYYITVKYNRVLEDKKSELEKINIELEDTKEKLEESVNGIKGLLDSTMESIFVFENGKCIDVNGNGVKLFGYENKKEMLGYELNHFVATSSLQLVKNSFASKPKTDPYEIILVRKDGSYFPAYVQGRDLVLNGKKVRISTAIDITELKEKDKIMFQQSKLASMGEMIGNIAHQWRQPLSLISTISTGIKFQLEFGNIDKQETIKDLDKLTSSVKYLSQTIEDFKSFFKINKSKTRFSVQKCIRKNLSLTEATYKNNEIEVKLDYDESVDISINGFENELTQALLNILNNAKDAYADKDIEEKIVRIGLRVEDDYIKISILDNAGGIEENVFKKIFEPYFTTKHQSQGTGIGLYMTHQIIVNHMNGSIEAENVNLEYNGKTYIGAKFMIKLPIE